MSNAVLERTHQIIGNIVRTVNISLTFIDENDPRTGILSETKFATSSTTNRHKCYSPGQLVFDRDMIIPLKHKVDWELIPQKKQLQMNKYNYREDRHIMYYNYKAEDNVMITKYTS